MREEDLLPGGLADERPDEHFDAKQLKKGIEAEMEHTDDPEKAKEIAKDHLVEFPDYYDRLEDVEEKTVQQEPTPAPSLEHQDTAYEADWEEDERLEDEDHQIIEKEDKDLEVAMENLRQLEVISEEMDADGAVSRRLAVAMESAYPGILPEDYPLESFTVGASRTNLSVAMERINITKDQMKAGLIGAAVALLAKILHWIYKKFKGMGGSVENAAPAASESQSTAHKADDVVKEMGKVRDNQPIGDSNDDDAGGEKRSSPSSITQLVMEDNLTESDVKSLTVRDLGKVLGLRREALYTKKFNPIFHGLEEEILSDPSKWAKTLRSVFTVLRERVTDHEAQLKVYVSAADQFKHEGEGESSDDHKKTTVTKGNLLPKDFHFSPSGKGKNVFSDVYKLTAKGMEGSADDKSNLIANAVDALGVAPMTEKRDAGKVKLQNVEKLVHEVTGVGLDPSDFLERVKKIQDTVANWGGDAPPTVAEKKAVEAMREYQIKFKEDVRLTQQLANWYLRVTRALGRLLNKTVQANGQYVKEVKMSANMIVKLKDRFTGGEIEKLADAAKEVDEGLTKLSSEIQKWKDAVKNDREAAAKE